GSGWNLLSGLGRPCWRGVVGVRIISSAMISVRENLFSDRLYKILMEVVYGGKYPSGREQGLNARGKLIRVGQAVAEGNLWLTFLGNNGAFPRHYVIVVT